MDAFPSVLCVPAQPRWIEGRKSAGVEGRQIDRARRAVDYQLGHRLAGRRRIENAPDAVPGGYVSTVDTGYPADQRQAVPCDRAIASLPRKDFRRAEHR